MEEMKEIYNKLTKENKEVLNMVAKGMEIAQNKGEDKKIRREQVK